jgi:hypothetical protein
MCIVRRMLKETGHSHFRQKGDFQITIRKLLEYKERDKRKKFCFIFTTLQVHLAHLDRAYVRLHILRIGFILPSLSVKLSIRINISKLYSLNIPIYALSKEETELWRKKANRFN